MPNFSKRCPRRSHISCYFKSDVFHKKPKNVWANYLRKFGAIDQKKFSCLAGASKKAVVQEKKFVKKCTVCCLENMESGMLEKMVCKYSQVQGSRAQRKLVVFNLQDVQEKLDQVGVQMDE